ncbi:D-alanyl-D-alanine carboxypeptidase [Candidatus Peregrinibacteria bacterium]|nr:D-alanyl-D-alanine carboxypeptidase [Candidatus Peregrinibacteria bacterium]
MITTFLNLYAAVSIGSTDIMYFQNDPESRVLNQYASQITSSVQPIKTRIAVSPLVDAESAIIIDFESGKILYEKNSNQKMQIASITKLMTAIIALEEGNMDEIVTVSTNAAKQEGSKIWLLSGERITFKNLLYAVLIHSGNDAAYAIAEHLGNGDVKIFVEKMNQKAKDLGLLSTHFENPIGFDAKENYSTAYDLSLLARYAYRKPFIRTAVKIKSMSISSTDNKQSHELKSTNEMLDGFLNVLGLKTGHTELAGLCFVSIIQNNEGRKIISVVLKSPDRFFETKSMALWAFKSFVW